MRREQEIDLLEGLLFGRVRVNLPVHSDEVATQSRYQFVCFIVVYLVSWSSTEGVRKGGNKACLFPVFFVFFLCLVTVIFFCSRRARGLSVLGAFGRA